MSTLSMIVILLVTVPGIWSLCSNLPVDQNRPPVLNCVDPYVSGVYRTGTTDPRWYHPSYPSAYPHPGYYSPQPYSGNGYSYGYNDVRRAGPTPQVYYPSNQGSYYANSPTYGRITSYSQAMHGSQYQPIQNSNYNPYASNYYPVGHVYHANHVNPSPMSHYGYRSDQYSQPFADPNLQMQSQFVPRPNLMREGTAVMKGHPSMAVSGTIEFCQVGPTSVRVRGRVTGIPGQPGNRGLHVLKEHACPPLDQLPVDGKHLEHFNPLNSPSHGSRDSAQKHAGDLGNVFVQFDGVANIDFLVNHVTLEDPAFSIGNHSIVITDRADDLGVNQNIESRLRGNSGRAVACGIIHMRSLPPSFPPQFPAFAGDQFSHREGHYSPYPPNFPFRK